MQLGPVAVLERALCPRAAVATYPARKVVIFGSTRVAELTAKRLCSQNIQTVLVDPDPDRVRHIATENPRVVAV